MWAFQPEDIGNATLMHMIARSRSRHWQTSGPFKQTSLIADISEDKHSDTRIRPFAAFIVDKGAITECWQCAILAAVGDWSASVKRLYCGTWQMILSRRVVNSVGLLVLISNPSLETPTISFRSQQQEIKWAYDNCRRHKKPIKASLSCRAPSQFNPVIIIWLSIDLCQSLLVTLLQKINTGTPGVGNGVHLSTK